MPHWSVVGSAIVDIFINNVKKAFSSEGEKFENDKKLFSLVNTREELVKDKIKVGGRMKSEVAMKNAK